MSWRRARKSVEESSSDAEAALTAAIALLARRDLCGDELRGKLQAKGFDDNTAAAVVAELTRQGIVNDERYTMNYVAYGAGRGHGPLRIAAELRHRGLAAAIVDAALAAGPDWAALARRACRARFGPQPPGSWAQKARQARFLQYRGFSSDHIRTATGADPDSDSGLTDL